MLILPTDLRRYAGFPDEVPDALLSEHLGNAQRDLVKDSGLLDAPVGAEAEWREAVMVWALASVMPFLHTFTLSGAAKVGRLEGAVEWRFQDPNEIDTAQKGLMGRYWTLVWAMQPEGDPLGMVAI